MSYLITSSVYAQVTEIGRKGWTNVVTSRSDYDETPRTSLGAGAGERSSLLSGGSGGYAPLSGYQNSTFSNLGRMSNLAVLCQRHPGTTN